MVKYPVLFETFARVSTARVAWEHIKASQPSKLYFYSNKARSDRPEEVKRNEEIRGWIKEIDWECELHTWFRDEYVDVYTSLKGSKDWALKNEEAIIVIEDDCVASNAFFQFCDHFLDYYKDNSEIQFISGNNYTGIEKWNGDHIISPFCTKYGMALWKDRWQRLDFHIRNTDISFSDFAVIFKGSLFITLFFYTWDRMFHKHVHETQVYDAVLDLNCYNNNWKAIAPICNLTQNVGVEGTHSQDPSSPIFKQRIHISDNYHFCNKPVVYPENVKFFKLHVKMTYGLSFSKVVSFVLKKLKLKKK